jgi:hypothetical protein
MPASRSARQFIRSNIVGFVALFVALGGVAWGASTAPKNSVVSKSIKNGQVKSADLAKKAVKAANLAPNAVSGAAVADGSLTGADVQDGSVATADLAANAVTGAKLDVNDVIPALGIRRAFGSATPGNSTTFFSINTNWQLKGYCVDDGSGTGHAYIALSHQGPEALLDVSKGTSWTDDRFTNGEAPTHLAQTVVTSGEASAGGQFLAQLPGFANNFAGTVAAAYDALDFGSPTCTFLFNGGGS